MDKNKKINYLVDPQTDLVSNSKGFNKSFIENENKTSQELTPTPIFTNTGGFGISKIANETGRFNPSQEKTAPIIYQKKSILSHVSRPESIILNPSPNKSEYSNFTANLNNNNNNLDLLNQNSRNNIQPNFSVTNNNYNNYNLSVINNIENNITGISNTDNLTNQGSFLHQPDKRYSRKGLNSLSQDFYMKISQEGMSNKLNVKNNYEEMNKKAMENCKYLFSNANKRFRNQGNESGFSIMNNDSTLSKLNLEKINPNVSHNSLNFNKLDESGLGKTQEYQHSHVDSALSSNLRTSGGRNVSANYYNHSSRIENSDSQSRLKVISGNNNSNSNIFGNRARRQLLNMNSTNINEIPEHATERGYGVNFKMNETSENMQTQGSFISSYANNGKPPMNLNNLSKYKHLFTDASVNHTVGNLKDTNTNNTRTNNTNKNSRTNL